MISSIIGDMKVVKSKELTNDAVSYSCPIYIAILVNSECIVVLQHFTTCATWKRCALCPYLPTVFRIKVPKKRWWLLHLMEALMKTWGIQILSFCNWLFNGHNLKAYFVVTNAPGQSAFNQVARMLPNVSKELSGVIPPRDHFSTHLDNNNGTADKVQKFKEFKNF